VLLTQELIAQIRHLELRTKRQVVDSVSGAYRSAFVGRGLDFHEVRAYVPGDDVRHIDWNVTAKTGHPHVKVFREEREMSIMIIVDASASIMSPQFKGRKSVVLELSAALAWIASQHQDPVGLALFTDHVELYRPVTKGRGQLWKIMRDLSTYEPKGMATDFNRSFLELMPMLKRRHTCFLISDFLGDIKAPVWARFARKHDLTAVELKSRPLSDHDPKIGFVHLSDSESHWQQTTEFDRDAVSSDNESIEKTLGRFGIDYFAIEAGLPVIDPLRRFLSERITRRGWGAMGSGSRNLLQGKK
jgi:uncharacterized protein (DUF58 family)